MVELERRFADMEQSGVTRQILSVRPQIFSYRAPGDVGAELARIQNAALIDLAERHEERFHAMITLALQAPEPAIAELRRHGDNPIVRGVLVDANIAGRNLDDPAFEPVWAEMERLDLPALVHPYQAEAPAQERLGSYYLFNLIGNPLDSAIAAASVVFGGILDRYPRLRWCFVHGGGYAPYQLGRWDHGWRARPEGKIHIAERPPSEYFRHLYFDSLTHSAASLRFLGELVGWDRIMLGSDYPFDMGDTDPVGAVRRLGLDGDDERAVLSGTTHRFLRPLERG
jgi:aminocarboxymuconate-semialdehyde decarboxylase